MSVVEFQSLALGAVVLAGTAWASAATHTAASCAQRDVETVIARASPGDTVLIPAGTAAWSNSISLRQDIHLEGAIRSSPPHTRSAAPVAKGVHES